MEVPETISNNVNNFERPQKKKWWLFALILGMVVSMIAISFVVKSYFGWPSTKNEIQINEEEHKEISLKTTLLATIPQHYTEENYDVRGDFLDYGRDVYWYAYSRAENETPHIVILNGDVNSKTEHYNIFSGGLDRPFVYMTRGVIGGNLVVNGVKGKYSVQSQEKIAIGKTGKTIAYATKSPTGKWQVVVNDVPGKEYSMVGNIYVSPDEKRVSYIAYEDKKLNSLENKPVLILDGKETKLNYNIVTTPVFSPDSKKIAYFAARFYGSNSLENSECFIVVDENESPIKCSEGFFIVSTYGAESHYIKFSPDSQRVAFIIGENDEAGLYVDGEKYPIIPNVDMRRFVFSPNSKNLAYVAYDKTTKKSFVSINGKEGKKYNWIENNDGGSVAYGPSDTIVWSPNGEKIAYSACTGEARNPECMLVVATEDSIELEGQKYRGVSHIQFSPDNKQVVYLAESILGGGSSGTVKRDLIDAHSGKVLAEWARHPVFSTNGSIASIVSGPLKTQLVVNGNAHKSYNEIWTDPIFSNDGQSVGYGVRDGNELWWIVDKVENFEYTSDSRKQIEQENIDTFDPTPVAQKAVDYLNSTTLKNRKAVLLESAEDSGVVAFLINISGKTYTSYVTKNGKYIFTEKYEANLGSSDSKSVAQKAVDYLNSILQQESTAVLLESTENSDVIEFKTAIRDKKYTSYVTKNGKYIFPEAILTEK